MKIGFVEVVFISMILLPVRGTMDPKQFFSMVKDFGRASNNHNLVVVSYLSETECLNHLVANEESVSATYVTAGEDVAATLQALLRDNQVEMVAFFGVPDTIVLRELSTTGTIILMPHSSEEIEPENLRLDSKLFFYEDDAVGDFVIKEKYAIKSGPAITQVVGTWNETAGLDIPEPNVYERRSNLRGVSLVNALMAWDYYHELQLDEAEEQVLGVTGVFAEVAAVLAEKLNFKLSNVLPPDRRWGNLESDNRTWSGIMRMLVEEEADISTTVLTRTVSRAPYVDFSRRLVTTSKTLIAALDSSRRAAQFWVYLEIFPIETWITCLALAMAIAGGFFAIEKSASNRFHQTSDSEKFTFLSSIAAAFLPLLQLAYNGLEAKSASSKTLFLSSCLMSYVVFTYYTCDLTSRMTSGARPVMVRSFQDAIDGGYRVIVAKSGSSHDLMKHARKGSPMHRVYEDMKRRPQSEVFIENAFEDGLQRVAAEEKTLLFSSADNLHLKGDGFVALDMTDAIPTEAGWIFQKDSEFTELINYHLFLLESRGILKRISSVRMPFSCDHVDLCIINADGLL